MATCSSKASASRGDRQEVEDPAAAVVEQHDRRARAQRAARPSSAPRSWASATSPRWQDDAARPARRRRRRRTTVPSMPLAPRLASTRGGASRTRAERLDVADRHRGGDEHASPRRGSAAELARDARLAELVAERRGDRAARRRASAARQDVEPRRLGRGGARRRARRSVGAGRRRGLVRRRRAGSCQAPSGSNATWRASSSAGQPLRSGLEVGRSPTRSTGSGAWRGGEARVAQQRVVVRDRRRAAARARERVGEQRASRPRREGRDRAASAVVALVAPGTRRTRALAGALERRPARAGAGARASHGAAARPRRPAGSGSGPSSTSGSRSGKFRWTAPGPAVAAV